MKHYPIAIFVLFLLMQLACSQKTSPRDIETVSSPAGSTKQSTASVSNSLTNAKVETAVNSLVSDFRLGGSISVKGIQEIPQQNVAVADLQFDNFEYGVTNEGGLVRAKDFAPKSIPQDRSRLPSMEEMFPQRKSVYSKNGKATLSHYTDGRWVLKEVNWGFDIGIKGNVEIP